MMKAYVKTKREFGAVEFIEIPKPAPKDDEVLIQIKASAICGSDLNAYKYPPSYEFIKVPVALGHEYSGIVEAVGKNVTLYKVGDRVVGESNQYCGHCQNCHEGRTNVCENNLATGLHIDGAMAEYIAVRERLVHPIPDNVSFIHAALAQPCAISFHGVFDRGEVRPGDSVAVSGPGIVGFMAARAAQLKGAKKVFLLGTNADMAARLPIAPKWDIVPINIETQDVSAEIKKHTGDDKVDVAIECSGATPAIAAAVNLVRKGGSLSLLGIYAKPDMFHFTSVLRTEIRINSSYNCIWKNYEQALQLMSQGMLDLDPVIALYDFEDGLQAIQDGLDQKVLKPVLVMKD